MNNVTIMATELAVISSLPYLLLVQAEKIIALESALNSLSGCNLNSDATNKEMLCLLNLHLSLVLQVTIV